MNKNLFSRLNIYHFISLRRLSTASENQIIQNENHKFLQVAVIGAPNVGKSLFTNNIVRAALSAVSSKMDTTTRNVEAAICEGDTQLLVVDSPGAVSTSHARLMRGSDGHRVLTDSERAVERADHILVVQDATAPGAYIHHRVLHMLHRHSHIPSSLVLNKIDLVPRRSDLLRLVEILTNGRVGNMEIHTEDATIGRLGKSLRKAQPNDPAVTKDEKWQINYRKLIQKPTYKCGYSDTKALFREICGWNGFNKVFFVSSLTGEGIDSVRDYLKEISQKGEWKMDESKMTKTPAQQLCADAIRAAILDTTPGDVAYAVDVAIIEWQEEGEVLQIVGEIKCPKQRDGVVVIGKGGKRIAEIGRRVNEHLHSLFQRQLYVRLIVSHKGKLITGSSKN